MKNVFWIEDDMYLYTLPELYDRYLEKPLNEYKSSVISKREMAYFHNKIALSRPWEAYDDKIITTSTDPFNLSNPTFDANSPYNVYKIDYGPMRKCEYYLKGTHQIELTEQENKIVDFVQKEFLDKITHDMDAYDKVMAANKFLSDNVVYDSIAPDTVSESFVYLFEERKAVCCGFSQVFQFLMNLVDVECYTIDNIGVKVLSTYHAWNIVRLDDGNLYNVDTSVISEFPFFSEKSYVDYIDKDRFYIDLTCSNPDHLRP